MSEKTAKTFTVPKLNWVRCAMHDPKVPPWALEIVYCIVSHLNGKNGSPVRDSRKGALQRAARLRSCLGHFWRVGLLKKWAKRASAGKAAS
jgi:hypothetical protein